MAIEVEIEAGPAGMGELVEMGQQADAVFFETVAPAGPFTSKAVNPLVKALNAVLPLFGLDGDVEPTTERELQELDTALVQHLHMIAQAVADAVEADVLEEEMLLDLEATGDEGLRSLAARLLELARSKDFKRFLKEASEEEEEPATEEAPVEEAVEVDADALFLDRM